MLTELPDDSPLKIFPSRQEGLAQARRQRRFDVVVIGGGLVGCTVAWMASLQGLSVLLLERADFGSGASINALGMFDHHDLFPKLRSIVGRKQRADYAQDWCAVAPHLVKSLAVRIVAQRRSWMERYWWGLTPPREQGPGMEGVRRCIVGDPRRLLFETLVMARQEGVLSLNYTEVQRVELRKTGMTVTYVRDTRTDDSYQVESGVVFNCAGEQGAELGRLSARSPVRSSHQDFFITCRAVLPTSNPTLVVTNDGSRCFLWATRANECAGYLLAATKAVDPGAVVSECGALLGLSECKLLHSLPIARLFSPSSPYADNPVWEIRGAMLRLKGGSMLSLRQIAAAGIKEIFQRSGRTTAVILPKGRLFPGAAGLTDVAEQCLREGHRRGVPEGLMKQAIDSVGARARYFLTHPEFFTPLGDSMLVGQVALAIYQEQAYTVEDLVVRRLDCSDALREDRGFRLQLAKLLAPRWGQGVHAQIEDLLKESSVQTQAHAAP